MNDMRYRIDVKTVGEEIVATYSYRSDNSYQDADRIIPNTLGEIRVTNETDIAPEDFDQGLYRYNLVYTDLVDLTDDADADFYFMGEKNLEQDENEYVILIGVDSKFAEKIRVDVADLSFELNVINGCAVLRTDEIPFNLETVLELRVSSKEETHLYKRSLVHAGNSWGMYRQNFLIIDRDFDGVEDLYETEISEWAITQKYDSYASRYADSEIVLIMGTLRKATRPASQLALKLMKIKIRNMGILPKSKLLI